MTADPGAVAEEAALLALAPVPPDRTVRYGPHPSQVIDVHDARGARGGGPETVVTLLHGGFWRQAYDRTHLSPAAAALARHGLTVSLAEYRRVGGDGGWPGTFDDVVRAVEAGADRGGPGTRHVVAGHSAGGHLALWAASRRRLPADSRWEEADGPRIDRVVALAPVAD
ncbi:alpha/beta hydrolase, partial [Streptomyces sp. NPDC057654]|uniref:alpha/beta hydrolase n=1 Tax=Streptomyces sp. NPDC057654 TaxID=3346196 RepID=UPI0036B2556F